MSRRITDVDELYGMRVVPNNDDCDGLPYGGFEGIVIVCNYRICDMEMAKMVRTEERYGCDSFIRVTFDECLEHGMLRSGKEFAEFLYSKAKEFSGQNEEIAIIDRLAWYIMHNDHSWNRFQKLLKDRDNKEITN